MKEHLINTFPDDILIHPSKYGHIITYIDAGTKKMLIANWYKKQQTLEKQEKRDNICILVGEITSEDIRAKIYDTTSYPAPVDFLKEVNDDVPRYLKLMPDEIVLKNKRKPEEFERIVTTIAHIIISAACTRSLLSPILIGLEAMFDKLYGSKELVQTLHAAGLTASYDGIRLFEAFLLVHSKSDEEKKNMFKDAYILMVFDNTDHDVGTIDGKNTFHVEGGIKILTPGSVVSTAERIF